MQASRGIGSCRVHRGAGSGRIWIWFHARLLLPPLRLKDARGGDVAVRPGLVSEAPVVRLDPTPMAVVEGGLAQLKVVAWVRGVEGARGGGIREGVGALRESEGWGRGVQMYRDGCKLAVATSDSPTLVHTSPHIHFRVWSPCATNGTRTTASWPWPPRTAPHSSCPRWLRWTRGSTTVRWMHMGRY